MQALSQSDLALLRWTQETIKAAKFLSEEDRTDLAKWIESGKKRSEWPYWQKLVGPKPGARKLTQPALVKKVRKTA